MKSYWIFGLLCTLLLAFSLANAKPGSVPYLTLKRDNIEPLPNSQRNPGDTIFFEDFESGAPGWTSMDVVITDTFWHIDPLNAYAGNSFWCGTMSRPGWVNPGYGYGDEWAQFLESPAIDLSSVTGDTLLLTFAHRPSNEVPSGGYPGAQWDGWDCVTVWTSTDDGATWTPIEPDTVHWPNTAYNIRAAWSYYYNYLAGEFDSIPGWGWGANMTWSDAGFDLTPYIGDTIRIRFTGFSDPAESDESGSGSYNGMWNLDNIRIYDDLNNDYFYEDCESGMGLWNAHPTDPLGDYWHITTASANSPTHSYGCFDSLTGQFPLTGSYCALASPLIDLSLVSTGEPCLLDFYMNYQFGNPYGDDGFRVELSTNNGETWYNATGFYYNGSTNNAWVRFGQQFNNPINLTSLIGQDSLRFRIVTWNHRVATPGSGIMIDDCVITGKYIEFPKPENVMIYDDDLGAQDVYGFGWEKYYESALANIGLRCARVTESDNGIPDSLVMRQNGMVIWHLGPKGWKYLAQDPIKQAALQNILGYLRMGGKIMIVGQDYLFNNYPNFFADSILLITGTSQDVGCDTALGIAGEPISEGLNCALDFGHLNGNSYGVDYVDDVTTGATPVFNDNRTGNPVMLKRAFSNYRLIFSAFPLEAISNYQARDSLMARIIAWIDPYPPAPVIISAVPHPPTGISVFWHPNQPYDLSGYHVYRSRALDGPYTQIGSAAAAETSFVDTLVLLDSLYYYGVKAFDPSNQESGMSDIVSTVYQTGVLESGQLETKPRILRFSASPNPFHDRIDIRYSIQDPGSGKTSLKIFDVTGRLVKNFNHLTNNSFNGIVWHGTDDTGREVPAGVYFIQLEAGDVKLTEKTVLLK